MVTYNYNTGKPLAAGEKQATVNPSGQKIGAAVAPVSSNINTFNPMTGQRMTPGQSVTIPSTGQVITQGKQWTPTTAVDTRSQTENPPIVPPAPNTTFTSKDTAYFNSLTPVQQEQLVNNEVQTNQDDSLRQLKEILSPVDNQQTFLNMEKAAGIEAKKQREQDLASKLSAINAQSQASQLQVVGQGRGIPETIIGGQQAQIAREAAIQSLPLQAEYASAKGDLDYATSRLDKLFEIKSNDLKSNRDYALKVFDFTSKFADKQTQAKLDEIKLQKQYQHEDLKNLLTDQNTYAKMAYENNQSGLGSQISKLDYKSPTFKNDLANLQAKLIDPVKSAQLKKLNAEIAGIDADNARMANGGVTGDLTAYATSYADTGKLPSPAELKLSGLNIGQVTEMAKQIPREKGSVVSKLTGSKSTTVPALLQEDFSRLYNVLKMTEELAVLDKNRVAGLSGGTLSKIFGGTPLGEIQGEYLTKRKAIIDEISRMQSGAALTVDEVAFYKDYLPGRFSEPLGLGQNSDKVIENFRKTMDTKLRNGADNNGLSVYGYSTVNVGGKNMTVGDVIDIEGENYRVLSDGRLTDIL